jgi:multicomponent Na+:H+ antiporter subunit D
LTKVGIYALIRVLVMLLPLEREQLSLLIAVAGAATTVLGALGALAQDDIRKLLGYVVISGIGNMLIGVAIATTGALSGAVFYAIHAMLVMTALYLVAGQAAFLGGSYSLTRLGGLYRRNGLFAALSLILFLAACGLPPFSGFWPKLILVKASLDVGAWWLAAAILIAGFVTTLAFGRVFLLAYWRPATESAETYVAIGWRPLLPLILLCALVVGIGILPERLLALTQSAAAELTDPYAYIQSVFPGGVAP